MTEIVPIILSGAVAGLSGFIGTYAMFKLAKKSMKKELEVWINSDTGRVALQQIGKLIVSGAMPQAKASMPKMKDAVGIIMLGAAQKYGLIPQMPQLQSTPPSTEPQT